MLASLGYRGGLKAVERTLGIGREPSIRGVDGFEAVRLWRRHERGDRAALEKLLLYNLTDVVNLVELLEIAIVEKCRVAAFPGGLPGAKSSLPKFDAQPLGRLDRPADRTRNGEQPFTDRNIKGGNRR